MKTHVEHTGASQSRPFGRSRMINASKVMKPTGWSTLCDESRRKSMVAPRKPMEIIALLTAASPAKTSMKSRSRSGGTPPWASRAKARMVAICNTFSTGVVGNRVKPPSAAEAAGAEAAVVVAVVVAEAAVVVAEAAVVVAEAAVLGAEAAVVGAEASALVGAEAAVILAEAASAAPADAIVCVWDEL